MYVGQKVIIRGGGTDLDGRAAVVKSLNSPLASTIHVPSLDRTIPDGSGDHIPYLYSESNEVLEPVFSEKDRVVGRDSRNKGVCTSGERGKGDRRRADYAGSKQVVVRVLWDDGSEYDVPVAALELSATNDEDR